VKVLPSAIVSKDGLAAVPASNVFYCYVNISVNKEVSLLNIND